MKNHSPVTQTKLITLNNWVRLRNCSQYPSNSITKEYVLFLSFRCSKSASYFPFFVDPHPVLGTTISTNVLRLSLTFLRSSNFRSSFISSFTTRGWDKKFPIIT